jgi:hypothetical protein
MAVRYFALNYRASNTNGTKTLEDHLRQCMSSETKPGVRFSDAPADRVMVHTRDGKELLLNEFADVVDGVAGIICEVMPGLMQPVLTREAVQKQLTKTTVSTVFKMAEQSAGQKEDFIQGLCYFYVRHNHLIFITVKGFRKIDVEPFFQWLLTSLQIGEVTLSAVLDKAEMDGDIGRVSKFRIKGSSSRGKGVALAVPKETRRRAGATTVAWSKAEEVVQAVLPQHAFERLMGSLSDKNRLVADVQWSVAGPRNEEVKAALREVVTELADIDDGIVGIAGKDGEIKDGGVILGTKRPFEVANESNVLIDFDHATDVLVSTFARWIEDKKLTIK